MKSRLTMVLSFDFYYEFYSVWETVDPDVDGRTILRGIFRKWEGIVGTGWSGLRTGTGGGHL
jgi:hypothetical protein